MVLEEFGQKISAALRKMQASNVMDDKVLDELLKQISIALLQSDVNVKLVKKLKDNVKKAVDINDKQQGSNIRKLIQSTIIQEMYRLLDSGKESYVMQKKKSNVIMFVGLQGSGKTTTCTKYAYYYRKRGWKVALVCADTFRAGAFDQLKQNATKANIPYYGSYTESDPVVVAEQGVKQFKQENYEVIIVDTSGRHKQEAALFEEMQEVAKVVNPDDIIFTMDGSIGQAASSQALAFKEAVDVGSCIITKLDGNAKGGGALSAVAATKSPIIFIGVGEHIDEFEKFDTKSFVSKLLGMGDISGLINLFQEKNLMDNPGELYKKLLSGNCDFTFRDMYEQFENLLKLGPLSQVMSMIPGLSNLMLDKDATSEGENRIKKFMSIMNSMNEKELDSDHKLMQQQQGRIIRIAKGSGTHPVVVSQVLNTLKPFRAFAERIRSLTKGGINPEDIMKGRGGHMNMKKMAGMLNPQMLQRMGGMNGLNRMMKDFGGPNGQLPKGFDPSAMQRMMNSMMGKR